MMITGMDNEETTVTGVLNGVLDAESLRRVVAEVEQAQATARKTVGGRLGFETANLYLREAAVKGQRTMMGVLVDTSDEELAWLCRGYEVTGFDVANETKPFVDPDTDKERRMSLVRIDW